MIRKLILLLAAFCICTLGWSAPANCPAPEVFKVQVCHIPPGNPLNKQEITITSNSMSAHLSHGDTVGACVVIINCNDGVCRQECLDNCILPPPPPPSCESSSKCVIAKLIDNTCTFEMASCNDGNACTTDSCDPAVGCITTNTIVCDDNSKCTEDACNTSTGTCVYAPIACPYGCHDPFYGCNGNPCEGKTCLPGICSEAGQCFADSYNAITGWSTGCTIGTAFPNQYCNDGNPSTPTSWCSEGSCISYDQCVFTASEQTLCLEGIDYLVDGTCLYHGLDINSPYSSNDLSRNAMVVAIEADYLRRGRYPSGVEFWTNHPELHRCGWDYTSTTGKSIEPWSYGTNGAYAPVIGNLPGQCAQMRLGPNYQVNFAKGTQVGLRDDGYINHPDCYKW